MSLICKLEEAKKVASNSKLNAAVHRGANQEGSEHCTLQRSRKTSARVASNKFPGTSTNLSQLSDRFIHS